ncbi:hypothetical protein DL98DRAFT_520635, partial [Cadophora sp. DSE1049]
ALTPEERRHAMGNSRDVYKRYYMPSFINTDCQAIYLRTTRREDLIRANELFNNTINNFHETVHIDEVDRQMRGIFPDNEVLTPSTIEYKLEERATVAKLLFQPLDELHEDQVFDIRVQLVHALAQLCHRQETPHQFKAVQSKRQSKTRYSYAGTDDDDEIPQEEGGNTLAGVQGTQTVDKRLHTDSTLYCPFCERGPFSRKDRCSAVMGNSVHFLSHTARQHEVLL